MTMDRYTRKLAKQLRLGQRSQVIPNEDGVLDLGYLLDLSGQFLGAQEKDVHVYECWQKDALVESLHELQDYAVRQKSVLLESLGLISYYLAGFEQSMSYNFETEFRAAVEEANAWVKQVGDSSLQGFMFGFYQQFQFFTYFPIEYVARLKAQAASIILNLASLGLDADEEQSPLVFQVDRDFIVQTVSEIVKPLLNIVNQERVDFFRKWSA